MSNKHHDIQLIFDRQPPLWPVYLRAPFKRNTLRDLHDLPRVTAVWHNVRFDKAHVERYRACCGLPADPGIPWTFPYLLVARLQLRLFTHPCFPLTPMGALHCRNVILCRGPIDPEATWTIETGLLPARQVKQGLELSLYGHLSREGRALWSCESAYLIRSRRLAGTGETPPEFRFDPLARADGEASWTVPPGTGRAYARVSGDWNPIHLGRFTAKCFGGFPCGVIHGMWSLARCVASLPADVLAPPFRLDVAFKGPVFMPGSCQMRYATDTGTCRADVYCDDNPRPVLQVRVTPLREENSLGPR